MIVRGPQRLAWVLAILVAVIAAGVAIADTPSPAITVPLPDGTVMYLRYGEPGGVVVNSKHVTKEGVPRTQPVGADSILTLGTGGAGLSVDVLRAMIREELAAMNGGTRPRPTIGPASVQSAVPGRTQSSSETVGSKRWATPQRSAAAPPTVVRQGAVQVGSAAPVWDGRELLESQLGRAQTTADSLSAMLQEVRPEVIREQLLDEGLFRSTLVLFVTDRADLAPRSQEVIGIVGGLLRDHPQLRVRVEGHADYRGPADRNLVLSQQRADAVAAYLARSAGVAPDRIESVGYGETRPLVDAKTATDLALNRRVEFRILNPEVLPATRGAGAG